MTALSIDMSDRDPITNGNNLKPTHNNGRHPSKYYSLMDDAKVCDAKGDMFSEAIDEKPDLSPKQRHDLSEFACSLYNLASALRNQAQELDNQYWKGEISAQEADWQDQARSERP